MRMHCRLTSLQKHCRFGTGSCFWVGNRCAQAIWSRQVAVYVHGPTILGGNFGNSGGKSARSNNCVPNKLQYTYMDLQFWVGIMVGNRRAQSILCERSCSIRTWRHSFGWEFWWENGTLKHFCATEIAVYVQRTWRQNFMEL